MYLVEYVEITTILKNSKFIFIYRIFKIISNPLLNNQFLLAHLIHVLSELKNINIMFQQNIG